MSSVKYLGSVGSYSYKVAKKVSAENNATLIGCQSIGQLLESSVAEQLIIMPLENSISGEVYDTYWALFCNAVQVIKYEVLEIKLCIQGRGKLSEIKNIYSHPQALTQCTRYIENNKLNPISASSTTDACEKVISSSSDENGVICDIDFRDSNLNLLDENISNHSKNYTKFLVVRNDKEGFKDYSSEDHKIFVASGTYKNIMMIFQIESDRVGSLMEVLNCLVEYKINLTNIKSKPIEGFDFEYFFIVEGIVSEPIFEKSFFKELKSMTRKVSISLF